MRFLRCGSTLAVTLAMLTMASGLRADDDSPVPIAEVIEAFKSEFRIAQEEQSDDCPLIIAKAVFRFDVARHEVYDQVLGKEVEVFGVSVGGSLNRQQTSRDDATINIAFRPADDAADSMFRVSGRLPGFAELILHTKSQIARAAQSDPPLAVEEVGITAGFEVKHTADDGISIAIVEGGSEEQRSNAHRVTLTLTPAEDASC